MVAEDRIVALVGRPNVGKSRLYNRLAGRRLAIVHDQPGVTRDVNSTPVRQGGYTLLDTGGLGLTTDMSLREIVEAAEAQVWLAVETATLICFVVDAKDGLTPLDESIAERLRASGRPVLLVINKVDGANQEGRALEFASLGFGEGVMVSAEHGRNEDILRTAIAEHLGPPPEDEPQGEEAPRVRLAFVGRPNVGKSSLANAIMNENRLVVSEVPGTTRDAISLDFDFEAPNGRTWAFRVVDTAGVRKRTRIDSPVEFFSVLRSRDTIQAVDVVFLVIDAVEGVTTQDKALAGEIVEAGKGVAVIVNKWDLALDQLTAGDIREDERTFREKYAAAALEELFFLPDSPVLFVSAKTGYALDRILRTARGIWGRGRQKISTPRLNRLFERLLAQREPKIVGGKRFKVYYVTQTGTEPLTFRLFCNRAAKLDDSYRRYLQKHLLAELDLAGCPIRFELRGKEVRYASNAT